MKKLFLLLALSMPLIFGSCVKTDDDPGGLIPTGNETVYDLGPKSDPSISGTATFAENLDGSTKITIDLSGTPAGTRYPAHIHANTAAEGGAILIDLDTVIDGMSTTVVQSLNDGASINYGELLDFDGYINVHLSKDNLGVLIAQGDIGANELTGNAKEYPLGTVSDPAISGTATFAERKNSTTLITVNLTGTADGAKHPAHIHANTAAEGGAILINLDTIVGPSGMSLTQIDTMNDGTPIMYDELIDFDGYLNVHLSKDNLGVLVAQGDIGQNALTGNSKEYDLGPVSNPDISGKVTFQERVNGETLGIITLDGANDGTDHPAHIHNGSTAEAPGAIIISFSPVNGSTGVSKTNITQMDDGTTIDYPAITLIDGYVNVHLSKDDLATLIAQGNVGKNSE